MSDEPAHLEVATSSVERQQFLGNSTVASCMAASARCSMPSSAAAPRHWAVIGSVRLLRPSGHLVQLMPQSDCPSARGSARKCWRRARLNCCPFRTSTSSSRWPHSLSALTLQNKRLLYDLLYRTSRRDDARTGS